MNPSQLDEHQLVHALTEVLHQQRKTLAEGGPGGAVPVAPIWQPLIDALDRFAVQRRAGGPEAPSPELAAEVGALRDEAQALQHTLTVWTAALRQAIGQSQTRDAHMTYGPGSGTVGAVTRPSLGRG